MQPLQWGVMMKRCKDIKGMTLLEVAIALFILAIGLLGLAGLQIVILKGDTLIKLLSRMIYEVSLFNSVSYLCIDKFCLFQGQNEFFSVCYVSLTKWFP